MEGGWWERRALGEMASPDGQVRIFRRRLVVLSSPHPVSECLQRLAEVTTSRGPMTWYLDPRTVGRPEPRFRGQVYRWGIRLVRFTAGAGRDSFFAVLDVRPGPGTSGGRALSGWMGGGPGVALLPVFTGAFGLVSLGLLVAGVVQLVLGHLIGLAPTMAFPLPVAAVAGINAVGHRSLERDTSVLLKEVNKVLGSTVAFPGSSPVPVTGGNDA